MEIFNTYTCYVSPLCSQKCQFLLIFKVLGNYSDINLSYLKNLLNVNEKSFDNKQKLISELSQLYNKIILSSINNDYHYHLLSNDST